MKATCISGSQRPNGNTASVLNEIFRALQERDIEITYHCLGEKTINYCTGCKSCYTNEKCVINDDVPGIIDDLLHSGLVIMASPSYWGDVTGQMKVFIDRCAPCCAADLTRQFKNAEIKGMAVAVRAGQNKKENENLIHTFEHFLGHLNIPLISYLTVEGIDMPDDLKNKPEILKTAYDFGKSVIPLLNI